MKVLLTGATGFLGYRTLEKLVLHTDIDQIIATGRTRRPDASVQHSKISYQLGDLSEPGFAARLVKQADCIIHAAALSSPWGRKSEFERANVLTQNYLLEAAIKYKIRRYIFVSTPSIYFNSQDRFGIKESDPLPPKFVNDYAATKYQAELNLVASGLPYIILRPRALIGRGDTVIMPRMIQAFKAGKLRIIGNGQNKVDLTSVANMVDAVIASVFSSPPALGEAYNISNGNPVLLWECIENVLSALGYTFLQKRIPYPIANSIAGLMEWRARATDYKEPVLTRYSVGTLAKSFSLDISKAQRLLGYVPAVTTEQALNEFVQSYTPTV
jgi:nucleoside-diphosphate-sugar epimerase